MDLVADVAGDHGGLEESARRVIGMRVTTDEDVARMHTELAKRPF